MIQRGIATFGLDYGTCPRWLFDRMTKLGQEMIDIIVTEYGSDEFVKRMGDPVWFQSLGTVLAFDWNASGLTTVLTGALKQAIRSKIITNLDCILFVTINPPLQMTINHPIIASFL